MGFIDDIKARAKARNKKTTCFDQERISEHMKQLEAVLKKEQQT